MKKTIKISREEIEYYTLLLDRLMALRTLKKIAKESNIIVDCKKVNSDYVRASEDIRVWWDDIMESHNIIDNGKKKSIDYQRNAITFEI